MFIRILLTNIVKLFNYCAFFKQVLLYDKKEALPSHTHHITIKQLEWIALDTKNNDEWGWADLYNCA